MFEKVTPSHPDKLADRIAGALVDMAYELEDNPKIAVEVLIGHCNCYIIYESSVVLDVEEIMDTVRRIAGNASWYFEIDYNEQDEHLADNQSTTVRCGDNGIFKGMPVTREQQKLSATMRSLYKGFPYDGKAVADMDRIILCQSNASADELVDKIGSWNDFIINPLGYWTGGTDVDTGATNRKLGSDMGDAITGGGLHGKDLSKADVSVNIACHVLANRNKCEVEACCAIGDEEIRFGIGDEKTVTMPYSEVVDTARDYVAELGGFEKLAEWGLV